MMTHKVTRKCLLVIAACLLVLAMIVSGPILSAVKANSVPSVSIEPSSQTVSPGSSFSIDVVVDSRTYNLKACHVEVSYDSTAFAAGTVTEAGLLGTNILIEPGSGITNGVINYGVTRRSGNTPVPVSGTFITIPFTVSDTASPGNYDIDVHDVILKDENNNSVAGVTANDGTIVVSMAPADILAYYRAYSGDLEVVETTDLLKAANDWASEVVPPDFTEPISTTQLLTLANEWAATE